MTLTGDDRHDPPVIRGGVEGLKLTRPTHAVLRDLIVEEASGNGLNADDGGDRDRPAGPLTLRRVVVRDSGGPGNLDGFKLSGIDGLRLDGCAALRWGGGQGIDLVGCHEVEIRDCRVDGGGDGNLAGPAVGVQAKGGCRDVLIADCRVEGVTERCVNLGGHTGLSLLPPRRRPVRGGGRDGAGVRAGRRGRGGGLRRQRRRAGGGLRAVRPNAVPVPHPQGAAGRPLPRHPRRGRWWGT